MKREYKKKAEHKCEIDRLADIWQKTKDDLIDKSNVSYGTMQLIYDRWWDNYIEVCKKQVKEKNKIKVKEVVEFLKECEDENKGE